MILRCADCGNPVVVKLGNADTTWGLGSLPVLQPLAGEVCDCNHPAEPGTDPDKCGICAEPITRDIPPRHRRR